MFRVSVLRFRVYLTPELWVLAQVVLETRRSREDIDMALSAMLRRQELPGGRVPVQTTERLFRESVPVLRKLLENQACVLKSHLYSEFHIVIILLH